MKYYVPGDCSIPQLKDEFEAWLNQKPISFSAEFQFICGINEDKKKPIFTIAAVKLDNLDNIISMINILWSRYYKTYGMVKLVVDTTVIF